MRRTYNSSDRGNQSQREEHSPKERNRGDSRKEEFHDYFDSLASPNFVVFDNKIDGK